MESTLNTLSALESQALDLLGAGVSQVIVASTLGVTESRISQMMADDDFKDEVIKRRFEKAKNWQAADANLDAMEDLAAQRLKKAMVLCHKPTELARIFEVLNKAKRRSTPDAAITNVTQNITTIVLPGAFLQKFRKNEQAQIVEVDGQALITAQPTQVAGLSNKSSETSTELIPRPTNETLELTSEQHGKTQSVESRKPRESDYCYDPGAKFRAEDL